MSQEGLEYTPRERRATVVAASIGWMFNAMDVILLMLLREQVARDLEATGTQMDMAIGLGLAASAVGGILFSQLGDRIGRKRALSISILIYSLATAAMAFSWDIWSLMAFRAVAGVGTGGEWSLGFALVSECWKPSRRGAAGGGVQMTYNLGTYIAIAVAWALGENWRWAFGLAALPALAVAYIRQRVPESKLWTRMKDLRERGEVPPELEAAMKRVPVASLFRRGMAPLTLISVAVFTLMNFAFFTFSPQLPAFLQSPATEGGLAMGQDDVAPYFLLMTTCSMVASFLAGLLSDRLGRRRTYALFASLGTAGFALMYWQIRILTGGGEASLALALVLATLGFGVNGVVGAMFTEVFPTHLRSTGPGFASNMGKTAALFAPLLGGFLARSQGWPVALAAPALFLVLLVPLVFLLPRATGRDLEPLEERPS